MQRTRSDAPLAWQPRPLPPLESVARTYVEVTPFDPAKDAKDFHEGLCGSGDAPLWTYIPMGPFESASAVADFFGYATETLEWTPYVFRRPDDHRLIGTASHMRVRPDAGSAEVGSVIFSSVMQKTRAATEAMYLLAQHVFQHAGYRRYEWKCDDANDASKRAALRLGFAFEGVFRQDMVVRQRDRDTAWFSLLDHEWPSARRAFESWLDPENFDASGKQKRPLASIRDALE